MTNWLAKGTNVELEHTTNRRYARKIALDHLKEHPLYYQELAKMERRLKRIPKRGVKTMAYGSYKQKPKRRSTRRTYKKRY